MDTILLSDSVVATQSFPPGCCILNLNEYPNRWQSLAVRFGAAERRSRNVRDCFLSHQTRLPTSGLEVRRSSAPSLCSRADSSWMRCGDREECQVGPFPPRAAVSSVARLGSLVPLCGHIKATTSVPFATYPQSRWGEGGWEPPSALGEGRKAHPTNFSRLGKA